MPATTLCSRHYTENVRFRVVLEYDPVAQGYSAVCPELPGCASAGDTEADARKNIEEAIRLYLAPSDLNLPDTAKLVEVVVG
jgi:predicted RNase H-like HicB family nuclease